MVGTNAVHAGFRWVNNGVLKPALVEMYKREYIFDKQKCIELLKVLSSQRSVQASYARKILAKMGINTDLLSVEYASPYFLPTIMVLA